MNIRQVWQAARLVRQLGDWSNKRLVDDSEREHEFHKHLYGLTLILEECEKELPEPANGKNVADVIAGNMEYAPKVQRPEHKIAEDFKAFAEGRGWHVNGSPAEIEATQLKNVKKMLGTMDREMLEYLVHAAGIVPNPECLIDQLCIKLVGRH